MAEPRRATPEDIPATLNGGPDVPAADLNATTGNQPSRGLTPAQLVPVKIAGRDFTVPPEVASAYEERERQFAEGIRMDREAQREYDQLKAWRQQIQTGPSAQPQQPDLARVWYENPAQAALMVQQSTLAQVEAQRAEDRFWDRFFTQHPDYRDTESYVRHLAYNEHRNTLMAIPDVAGRIDKLAEITGKETLKLLRKGKATEPTNGSPPARPAERASGERVAEPPAEDKEEQELDRTAGKSLASVINARRKQRLKAAGKS